MTGMNGSGSLVTVATCNLNQHAMDFDNNLHRVYESCVQAKQQGASYRLGPELELCGYGCEDHFLEADTFAHCWESLALLLERGATDDLLCDFGMPVLYGGVRYNCRILCHNRKILLVRPKIALADGGNYRESRYFTAYRPSSSTSNSETLLLPTEFSKTFGQTEAPFGIQFLQSSDGTSIACESCEELWTPQSTHIEMALRGVDIIGNGSGSHHELRKLNTRLELMISATRKCGGVYLYSNQRGCDGGRTYFDGCAMIVCNGEVLAQAEQFDVRSVQVISATVDLDDVRSYRAALPSFGIQAVHRSVDSPRRYVSCPSEVKLVQNDMPMTSPTAPIKLRLHSPEEECCLGPACWLWDYLRRSGAAGFFLPLSGTCINKTQKPCRLVCTSFTSRHVTSCLFDYRRRSRLVFSCHNCRFHVPARDESSARRP
jgi:NAD+ synthase (glutamine-hydrolysing)